MIVAAGWPFFAKDSIDEGFTSAAVRFLPRRSATGRNRVPKSEKWIPRLPIALVLAAAVATPLLVAGGGALYWIGTAATQNAHQTIEDKGRLLLSRTEDTVRSALDDADHVTAAVEKIVLSMGNRLTEADLDAFLSALTAQSPMLGILMYTSADGWIARNTPEGKADPGGSGPPQRPRLRVSDLDARPSADNAPAGHDFAGEHQEELDRFASDPGMGPAWLPAKDPQRTHIDEFDFVRPVRRDGRLLGVVRTNLRVEALSRALVRLDSEPSQHSFVLINHTSVVAHPSLQNWEPDRGPATELPRIDGIGEPALAEIWTAPSERVVESNALPTGHVATVGADGTRYAYLYKEVERNGALALTVGSYFLAKDFGAQMELLRRAEFGAALILIASVAGAAWFGLRLGQPLRLLELAARAIGELELDRMPPLPPSRLREVDETNRAFVAAHRALAAFARYVPRALVRRLLLPGAVAADHTEARDMTILFTDIAGYTATASAMPPEEVAGFLNEHFALIAGCIEAQGGTVDKFIGDAVMAFWGAPHPQTDHAARAVRAARAIAEALRADNAQRLLPIRVRIGIDSGRVVVGNIGTDTRTNYTVIGDPVNAASRLEQLGKQAAPDAEIVALASEATATLAPDEPPGTLLGRFELRGRPQPIDVYRVA